ncbi:hypothetical protein C8R44DRAFT_58110 [Mycena epipterygia]|nr:hypothetical protein C8R44DRAFT_58110 [Mycena epipterygia]
MANLLARFRRGRTKSLSATPALTSPGPTLPATPAPAPIQPTVPVAQISPLERKIHPDLDSLVADWTPPPAPVPVASVSDPANSSSIPAPFPTALRPSTRRHSVDGTTPVLRPPQTDTHLDDLPELPVPIPFTAQPQPPTRARRLITRITGSSTPPSSTTNVTRTTGAGWSTFGRRANRNNEGDDGQPHLTEFGERGRGSPAPSQGASVSRSHSFSRSRSPSQVNLGTPSTTSQQLDESVTYSNSGHGHPSTPASDLPSPASPASGFTFGSQGRASGRASTSASPPPPMPPLDHPAFRSTGGFPPSAFPSQVQLPQRLQERHQRSSSSLPSMHSASRRKRFRGVMGDRAKAQDIFGSLSRPPSARRRASAEFSSSQTASTGRSWEANVSPVFLALGASGGSEGDDKLVKPGKEASGPDDLRDFKFDTRAKRVVCPSNPIFSLHLHWSLTLFVLFVGGVVRHAARRTFCMV